MTEKHARAEPLPADDRRRAIVEAVGPLVPDKGSAVTTRERIDALMKGISASGEDAAG